jgi:GTPase
MERKSGIVVITGRPNAGKSTLLNRALGTDLSIVTPKPQTTREGIRGIFSQPQGQIVFVDTPGVHRAREDGVNAFMMAEVDRAFESPDLVWYLVDPRSALEPEKPVIERVAACRAPAFLIINKSDLHGARVAEMGDHLEKEIVREAARLGLQFKKQLRISARSGLGCEELIREAWGHLSPGPILFPDEENLSDRNVRFFVGELVREQLFLTLGEELPYSCAVSVTDFQEDAKPTRISATIFVERDSQKGMVIGKGGAKIKEIGSQAREKIQELVGGQVFLGLKVEVMREWSSDPGSLKRLGYVLPPKNHKNRNRA